MTLLKVVAFKNHHRMTMHRGKSKDCPEVPCGEIGRTIIVEAGGLIDIARKGKEMKNPWTNKRDRAGRSSFARRQGRRIHRSHHGFVFVSVIQTMRVKMVMQ